ncbi:hypothetical protein [Saccharothrix sp. HUAS TT1]|uniref:hypothetical protein n=1 Tax=unclassified Saccharothrix TaxID=2593673 RepID=UPI00345C103F
MTDNARSKRRNRDRARRDDQPYTRARGRRSDPWRADGSNGMGINLSRADLERLISEVEPDFREIDPYRRQAAYSAASRLYDELVHQTDDPTWKQAARMAAQRYAIEAARIRWQHRIPSPRPLVEATLLGLGSCGHCGRPWSSAPAERCEHCPQLVQGPTPDSAEGADHYGPGSPADMEEILTVLFQNRVDRETEDAFRAGHHGGQLDPALEHLAQEIATHHVADTRQPFDTSVENTVRRHGVDASGWTVEDLAAAIIHGRELVSEHGIMTWTMPDGRPSRAVAGGSEETRAHDTRTAARLLGTPEPDED